MISATTNYTNAATTFKAGRLFYAIEIAGYSRVFTNQVDGLGGHYPWLTAIDDYSITINDQDGGADLGNFSFHVQDRGGAITGDFPGFTFEGKKVTLKQGFAGLAYADYVTLFTGYVDSVISENSNLEYGFQCHDMTSKLDNVVFLTGDDSAAATSSTNMKTVSGHPLDLLMDILEVELGLSSSTYNKTKLQNYRDGIFSGMRFVFHLDQSPAASDFIKAQLMKPLLGYMWCRADGTIDFNFAYPSGPLVSVAALGADTWLTIPTAEQTDLINIVQFQFDKNDGSITVNAADAGSAQYLAESTQEYAASIAKYGQYGLLTIPADGLRSAFEGFFIAAISARLVFQRYGLKTLRFDQANGGQPAEALWNLALVEPGDIVTVTHPKIPDRTAGVVGITGKLFEVFNKTLSFSAGRVTYTLLDAAYLTTFGQFLIVPDGHADYAGSSGADRAKYMFMTDDTGHYSNGDPGNGLG